MKPLYWRSTAALGLVLLGYLAGRLAPTPGGNTPNATTGSRAGNAADPAPSLPERPRKTNSTERLLFKSGTPFSKGQARSWFLGLARENWDGDPAGMVRMIQECTTMDENSALELAREVRTIMEQYEARDPEIRGIFKGDDLQERALFAAIFRLSQLNPEAALAFVNESKGIEGKGEITQVIYSNMALEDLSAARASLAKLEGGELRNAMEGVLGVLVAKDPLRAIALIKGFPQPELDGERRKLVERLAERDPLKAVEVAAEIAGSGRNPDVLEAAVGRWMRMNEGDALRWAASYNGTGASSLKGFVLAKQSEKDPTAAASALSKLVENAPPDEFAGVASKIAGDFAGKDLGRAVTWVESLPSGAARESAELALVDKWVRSEPIEAAGWINDHMSGAAREAAAKKFIEAVNRRYPESAFEWAQSLTDGEEKERIIQDVMNGWRQQDPEAAEAAWKSYRK